MKNFKIYLGVLTCFIVPSCQESDPHEEIKKDVEKIEKNEKQIEHNDSTIKQLLNDPLIKEDKRLDDLGKKPATNSEISDTVVHVAGY